VRLQELRRRFGEQEHELHVHQIELEIQNEELRRANFELEVAHNRYADLFEFAPVGYVIFEKYDLIEQINLTGCTQLGAVRQQLIGRRLSLFVEESQRVAFANLLHGVFLAPDLENPPRHRMSLRMVRQDGSGWDAQLECVILQGRPKPLARAVLTDVTALQDMQREVERLNHTLEQRVEQRTAQTRQLSEEMRTFVYSVTHDMTRPTRQIQGFAVLLRKSMGEPDESEEKRAHYLALLLEASTRLNTQMASLISFFQSNQALGQPQPLDLNRLVESLFLELEPETAGREVRLTHDRLPTVQGDHLSLRTIFLNLLSNAVKFTTPKHEARIHVGCLERQEDYLFSVRDNGVGFDVRQSERLFGLFQRLHSERSFEGQGMGLALVRRIVNRCQGRVWAESVLNEGSVFWVQLPKESVQSPDEAEAAW